MLRRQIPAFSSLSSRLGATTASSSAAAFFVARRACASSAAASVDVADIDSFCQHFLGADQVQRRSTQLQNKIEKKASELAKLDAEWNAAMVVARKKVWWIGAGIGVFLAAQWAVLANWVFVVFDWNLVEPVTYFLACSCGWFGTVYYAVTGNEWTYESINDAMAQRFATKTVMKANPQFLQTMERLREEIEQLEEAQNSMYVLPAESQGEQGGALL